MAKITLHKDIKEDIKDLPQEDKTELADALIEMSEMPIEELLEKSEPVDFEEMKRDEPELYETLMKRIKQIKKDD